MNIGEKIIKIRKEHNLTQEEMANELYLTRQAISKYERNISYPSLNVDCILGSDKDKYNDEQLKEINQKYFYLNYILKCKIVSI